MWHFFGSPLTTLFPLMYSIEASLFSFRSISNDIFPILLYTTIMIFWFFQLYHKALVYNFRRQERRLSFPLPIKHLFSSNEKWVIMYLCVVYSIRWKHPWLLKHYSLRHSCVMWGTQYPLKETNDENTICRRWQNYSLRPLLLPNNATWKSLAGLK